MTNVQQLVHSPVKQLKSYFKENIWIPTLQQLVHKQQRSRPNIF